MGFVVRMLKGAGVALAFIVPGISGATMLTLFGLFEPVVRFMANVRQRFRTDIWYFLPVGIGGVLGLVLLSGPLGWMMDRWNVIVLWGFGGAILGSVPGLWREAAGESPRTLQDWLFAIGGLVIGFTGFYLLPLATGDIPANFFSMLLAGFLIGVSVLVPGLSSSLVLLVLGLLGAMLDGLSNRDVIGTFLPIVIGALAALLLLSKLVDWMLDRWYSRFYHAIIGLVVASTLLILIPNHSPASIVYAGITATTIVITGIVFLAGLGIGLLLTRLEASKEVVAQEPDDFSGPDRIAA